MSLNNLSSIGHLGNFIIEKEDENESSSSSGIMKKSLYSSALDFEGTGNIFAGESLFTIGNSEVAEIGGSMTSVLDGSHNIKMLTFGLDTIFQVGQTGFLPNLENLGIGKYLAIESMMTGIKLPSPVALPLSKSGKKR